MTAIRVTKLQKVEIPVEHLENESQSSCLGAISGIQICPNCEKEHDSGEWNGYCSKICWWGFSVDYR